MLIAAHLMGLQEPFATANDLRVLVLGRELGHKLHRVHDNEMVPELVRPEPLSAALTWAWDAALVASERSAAALQIVFSVQTLQFREQFACCILDRFPWCAPCALPVDVLPLPCPLVRPEDDHCAV